MYIGGGGGRNVWNSIKVHSTLCCLGMGISISGERGPNLHSILPRFGGSKYVVHTSGMFKHFLYFCLLYTHNSFLPLCPFCSRAQVGAPPHSTPNWQLSVCPCPCLGRARISPLNGMPPNLSNNWRTNSTSAYSSSRQPPQGAGPCARWLPCAQLNCGSLPQAGPWILWVAHILK